jgi:hypothetical protein
VQRKRNEDRQKELESDAAKQKLELCAKKKRFLQIKDCLCMSYVVRCILGPTSYQFLSFFVFNISLALLLNIKWLQRVQDKLSAHVKEQYCDAKGKNEEQQIIDNLLVRRGAHYEVLDYYF